MQGGMKNKLQMGLHGEREEGGEEQLVRLLGSFFSGGTSEIDMN